MFCTGDEIVLQIGQQVHKVGAVAGDTHNEVPVFLRIFLRSHKGALVDHVKLHMPEFEVAERADEGHQFFCALLAFHAFVRKLDVQHAGGTVAQADIFGGAVSSRTLVEHSHQVRGNQSLSFGADGTTMS